MGLTDISVSIPHTAFGNDRLGVVADDRGTVDICVTDFMGLFSSGSQPTKCFNSRVRGARRLGRHVHERPILGMVSATFSRAIMAMTRLCVATI